MNGKYGINLKWFENYLSSRKMYIQINLEVKTSTEKEQCSVPQGSILGQLLYLLYVNDLQFASDPLGPIMFTGNTSLFYLSKDVNV